MSDDLTILAQCSLFAGIAPADIPGLLMCKDARRREFNKGATVIEEGSTITEFGIVLSGRAHSLKEEPDGRAVIVTVVEPGGFLGVLLASSRKHKSPVLVQAQEKTSTLFFPVERMITQCPKGCANHDRLLCNFLDSIAEMALELHNRNDCLIKSSVREKILAYLIRESKNHTERVFTVSLNREDMAKYLNVDRSALSRELSAMRREGLIDFHKSSFRLL